MRWIRWIAPLVVAASLVAAERPTLGISAASPGIGIERQASSIEPEAATWRAGVLAAGSTVKPAVLDAVSAFIRGCKQDASPNAGVSNWDAMKSIGLLAGPDTFAGIWAPLKGAAPTNSSFVEGDYNPATGLIGDGSTKRITIGRMNDADPQNNCSLAVWISEVGASANSGLISGSSNSNTAQRCLWRNASNLNAATGTAATISTTGLYGVSRSDSTGWTRRANGSNTTVTADSTTPVSTGLVAFARNSSGTNTSNDRISFYAVGEAVTLTSLDARLTTLMAALAAAHP